MLWKVLFWIYTPLYILLIFSSSLEVKWNFVDWLGIGAVLTGLLFLFAYAYNKNYFSKTTRNIIVATIVSYWIVYAFYLDPNYGAYSGKSIGDSIFNLIAVLPVFIPALLYSIKGRKQQ